MQLADPHLIPERRCAAVVHLVTEQADPRQTVLQVSSESEEVAKEVALNSLLVVVDVNEGFGLYHLLEGLEQNNRQIEGFVFVLSPFFVLRP